MNRKAKILRMRLDGMTYQQIGHSLGVSRQRIQQIISPPRQIRDFVIKKYNGRCASCGLYVGGKGHLHHTDNKQNHYNDIENLELLCITCHRGRHSRYGFI